MSSIPPVRTARVSPDRPWVAVGAILIVSIVMLASMIFSFTAITEAAAWTRNPIWAQFLAAVFIDGLMITFTVSYAVRRWRREGGAWTLTVLITYAVISAFVNLAHTASGWEWDFTRIETWFGMLIAALAPITALLTAEEITRLAFVQPVKQEEPAAESITLDEPESDSVIASARALEPNSDSGEAEPAGIAREPALVFQNPEAAL